MRQIEKILTVEDILSLTNGGRDIFEREGCKIQRKHIQSVFTKDSTPSMQIKNNGGIYTFADFSSGKKGNAISFIQELYSLSFKEALQKIKEDFNLSTKVHSYKRIIPVREEVETAPLEYDWEITPFNKEHHKYWNAGGLNEDFLRTLNIFALKSYAINKKAQRFTEGQVSFVYECLEGIKILNTGENVKPQNKWRTNVKKDFLWNFDQYIFEKDLFAVKSVKDMAVLLYLDRKAFAGQSENAQVLIENMPRILEKCSSPIINYGSNTVDKAKSIEVNKVYPQCRYFNTPSNLLKFSIEDNFDYVKAMGMDSFDKLLKRKGL
jgi:hypothetical protein